jgi:hypothetical protein
VFFFAACNSVANLPPELMDRFSLGTFYFDVLSEEEKPSVWKINLARYQLPQQELPNDDGWTGRNINNCCMIAWRLGIPLLQAATKIVPIVRSNPDSVQQLRKQAHNQYLSASYSGVYQMPEERAKVDRQGGKRHLRLNEQ